MAKLRRKKRIVSPKLQWKIILFFGCLTVCSVLLQSIILAGSMGSLAGELTHDGNVLRSRTFGFLGFNLALTLAFTLPVYLLVARTATFRVAGPLYNMENHLKRLIRGESPGACRIRKDDELQEFCLLLNQAIAAVGAPSMNSSEELEGLSEEPDDPLPALPSDGQPQELVAQNDLSEVLPPSSKTD